MASVAGPLTAGEAEKFFEEHVHPVLAKRCYSCHGTDKQESGLRLDSREAVLKGGDSGTAVVVPGEPAKSPLVRAIRHEGDHHMPPEMKLPDAEIALLTEWVAKGMPWSAAVMAPKTRSIAELAEQMRTSHWSLQPVVAPRLPQLADSARLATGVDAFVQARLDAAGITPSPLADRRTLIRRLAFDLLGLPPTPDEVDAFVNDSAPDAYERLVDRLLASPHYGERWGRHWLDVARYADTRGYAFQQDRRYPYSYTYRDYVIAALNADKPYDQFVIEQLAADKLPWGEDKTPLAAMGFLTTGRKFNNRNDDLDDQIDVVSRGLLGLTVACARCHDHKYDPVPTADYYSLYGVFASSQEPSELPIIGESRQSAAFATFQTELAKLRGELEKFRADKHAELLRVARERVGDYLLRAAFDKPDGLGDKLAAIVLDSKDIKPKLVERWRALLQLRAQPDDAVFGPWKELMSLVDAGFAEKAEPVLTKWRDAPAGSQPAQLNPLLKTAFASDPPKSRAEVARVYGRVFAEATAKWQAAGGNAESLGKLPEDVRQLVDLVAGPNSPTDIPLSELSGYFTRVERTEYRSLEKKVTALEASSPAAPPRAMVLKEDANPHNPRVLIRGNAGRPGEAVPRQFLLVVAGPQRQAFQQASGRLELARAIADAGNPLTRRVIANRIWMHHFGQSLVRTPSDFGIRCDPPVQRDLLDHLAARLLDGDWSLKGLHREIVLSNTYRQSSLFRADAVAQDPENHLLWRMNRRRLEFEPLRDQLLVAADRLDPTIGGRAVDLMKPPMTRRRAVYGYIDRQDLPNLFRVFDFPSPDQSQAERPRTTVPQQSLFLMNSPFVIDQAQALVARPTIAGVSDPAARLLELYRVVFQRPPTADESAAAMDFVAAAETAPEKPSVTPWQQLAQLLLLTNEFAYVD